MYNTIKKKYIERAKDFFKSKVDYKELYDAEKKIAEDWEFKYNKLSRQLRAIIKESDT